MNKWENITGDNVSDSIIRGSVKANNNVNLSNLTIENPKLYGESICLDIENVSPIIDNIMINGNGNRLGVGILISGEGSDNSYISGSEITNNGIGISYNNTNSSLENNFIRNNEYGVWFVDTRSTINERNRKAWLIQHDNVLKDNILRGFANLSTKSRAK